MPTRLTYEVVKQRFEFRGDVLLTTSYANAYQILEYICHCGNRTTTSMHIYNRTTSCKRCKYNAVLTIEEARNRFADKGCILLTKEYVNNYSKLDYVCVCGNKSSTSLASLSQGHLCSKCGFEKSKINNTKYSLQDIQTHFSSQGHQLLSYYGLGQYLTYKCNCGQIESVNVDANTLLINRQCRVCKKNKQSISPSRNNGQYIIWRKEIINRDEGVCQVCNCINKPHAHHLESFKQNLLLRYEVSNGETMCSICHVEFHKIYGRYTTTEMYLEYKVNKNV